MQPMDSTPATLDPHQLSRRGFLATSAVIAGSAAVLSGNRAVAGAYVRPQGRRLVVLYLRGGADGMSLVAPLGDPNYAALRPTTAISSNTALPLLGSMPDTRFAFHPRATRLSSLYNAGKVAIIPAAGLPERTRSHFDAQANMESALFGSVGQTTGWAGRWLSGTAAVADSPLRAVTIGDGTPASFRGGHPMSATSLASLAILPWGPSLDQVSPNAMESFNRPGTHPLLNSAIDPTLETLTSLSALGETVPPAGWPDSRAGDSLWPIARLIELGLPLEFAHAEGGHWDTHEGMGAADAPKGDMATKVAGLDAAIGAFFDRIGPEADHTTMVVMTEFGRRASENSSGGTDHGTAMTMLVIGGGVQTGVKGAWPGLAAADLEDGDLRTTVDYRQVLAEILSRRLGADSTLLAATLPGLRTRPTDWVGACW